MTDQTTGTRSLKVGDRIKDNDVRYPGRFLTIAEILDYYVTAEDSRGIRRAYARSRIHTDGKHRRSGFDLVLPYSGEEND